MFSHRIMDFHDIHRRKPGFILCNGPSLQGVDVARLKQYGPVFALNRGYLYTDQMDYLVAVNDLVLEQFGQEIQLVECARFLPMEYEDVIVTDDKLGPRRMVVGRNYGLSTGLRTPHFATMAGEPLWEGHTVTYVALQLAYWMGCDPVVLVGLDHDYRGADRDASPNREITSLAGDIAHFSPDYFPRGTRWHAPDLAAAEVAFAMARDHYARAGRRIINASSHTAFRGFETLPLNHVLDPMKTKVSAIVSAYKAEKFMAACMEDLLNQTETSMQIVVVAKAESQEARIAFEYAGKTNKEVAVVLTPDVPTVYQAWNLGLDVAKGRYITNANTDDRHAPWAYRTMAEVLDGRPDIDLVYHNDFITWQEMTFDQFVEKYKGTELATQREVGQPGAFVWPEYSRQGLSNGCYIGPHPMWRASLHQTYGQFLGTMRSAGDYEFWLRVSREANFLHLPFVLGLYRGRTDGIELSNMELSMSESVDAVMLHQTREAEFRSFGPEHAKLTIGSEYAIVEKRELEEKTRMLVRRA